MIDENITDQILAGKRRYRLAAYTTIASVVSKALSLLVLYISVPLTISYLGNQRFGVWMTLASFVSFLGFLDFGIGSSLVNEVAHYSATESGPRLNRLITHAITLLTAIGAVLLFTLHALARSLDLETLFNVHGYVDPSELRNAADILAVLIGCSLPIVGLQRVFLGLQQAFIYHLLVGAASVASLFLLFMLAGRHAGIGALLFATFGVQLVATLPLAGVLIFRGLIGSFDWREFRRDARDLLRHGTLFFILSVGGAVAWDGDYIIISRMAGAGAVATYAVGIRLFQLVEIPLQMINMPLWSAYADALAKGSQAFLSRTLLRAFLFTVSAAIFGVSVLIVFHELIIRIWVRQAVTLPPLLTYALAAWFVIRAGGNCFAMYLNGVRVVGPQVIVVIAFCVLALPLKLYGAEYYGALGVVVAGIGAYIVCVILPYLTVFRPVWSAPLHGKGVA